MLHDGACEITDGDDAHGRVHPAALEFIDALMNIFARPVVFGGMHVNDQRLAGGGGDREARGKRQPIMRMNHVDLCLPRKSTHSRA